MKAISKGSLAGCLVHLDAGSTDRLAQQNLQIPGLGLGLGFRVS